MNVLRNCDWLGLGPMSVGKWSTKDSWGAVTNRRRGAAEPLWTSRDITSAGRPEHPGFSNRRGGHCCDLLSTSWERFPGRQRRGGSCHPVLWAAPVRAVGQKLAEFQY